MPLRAGPLVVWLTTQADADNDKYFRIEADRLATPSTQYTTGSVKRIVDRRNEAKLQKKAERLRKETTVKRALNPGNLPAGLLNRELGVGQGEVDLTAATWATGLETRRMLPPLAYEIQTMFIGVDEDTPGAEACCFGGESDLWLAEGVPVADIPWAGFTDTEGVGTAAFFPTAAADDEW